MENHRCLREGKFQQAELIKSYIYSRNKETNNIKLGTKQKKTELIHSYLASEKERDDERSARRVSGTLTFLCFVFPDRNNRK